MPCNCSALFGKIKMEVLSPWSFVNCKQLILMGSKDSKLKTWAWDRSLSRNCRGFCLGQHIEIINFTVPLPARTNWWLKEEKQTKNPNKNSLSPSVLVVFPWLFCFQENTVLLLLALSFRTFSHGSLSYLSACGLTVMVTNVLTRVFGFIQPCPLQSFPLKSCFSCKQRNVIEV